MTPKRQRDPVVPTQIWAPWGPEAHLMLPAQGSSYRKPLSRESGGRDIAMRDYRPCPQIAHSLVRETDAPVTEPVWPGLRGEKKEKMGAQQSEPGRAGPG